jgi:Ran GTPase-activating protein (RanGAP) involved in mRNA processing and transport
MRILGSTCTPLKRLVDSCVKALQIAASHLPVDFGGFVNLARLSVRGLLLSPGYSQRIADSLTSSALQLTELTISSSQRIADSLTSSDLQLTDLEVPIRSSQMPSYATHSAAAAAAIARLMDALPKSLRLLTINDQDFGVFSGAGMPLLPRLPSLHTLVLRNNSIGPQGMPVVAESLCLNPSVRSLDVSHNSLKHGGALWLTVVLSNCPSLTSLHLSHNWICAEGAAGLAPSLAIHGHSLRSLNVRANHLGDAGLCSIARSLPASIETLDLSFNEIREEGAVCLGEALLRLPSLLSLDLSYNRIGSLGTTRIVDALPSSVQNLMLSCISMGQDGLSSLAASLPRFRSLRSLSVGLNSLTDSDASILADALPPSIETLDLRGNQIGDAGTARISRALAGHTPRSLHSLNLRSNWIGDAGAASLAGAIPFLPSLCALDICHNFIGAEGTAHIATSLSLHKGLRELSMSHNSVGAEGAARLADAIRRLPTLSSLFLGFNSIGDAGTSSIACALSVHRCIKTLSLDLNAIGRAGAVSLGKVLPFLSSLHTLSLGRNMIDDLGAASIAGALCESVSSLDLSFNLIGNGGAATLAASLPRLRSLARLKLGDNSITFDGGASLEFLADVIGRRV